MQVQQKRKSNVKEEVVFIKAIVTVKLKRNPAHNPSMKQSGMCPLDGSRFCTDITGNHHSYIVEGRSVENIYYKVRGKGYHVTRIEVI